LLAALACGPARGRDERPLVAVSIPPLAWFVERLAGAGVAVATLLPAGANPHSYEPTLDVVRAVSRAALWFEVGHPSFAFERTAGEALAQDRGAARAVQLVGADGDPHAWLSPPRAREIAGRVAAALQAWRPAEASTIEERRVRLDTELERLDREVAARLAPFRGRAFFVYHPDWSAFAADYGLRQVALERGHREPDARSLHALIEEARREGARAIFVQPQFSKESAELVAHEVGARVIVIDPLAYAWPAAVGEMSRALAEVLSP
jgi:zinc transport system substrate-binding protein